MIETIKYYNFRNFTNHELHPGPGVTLLVGKNATGKTNTLEGIQLLTTGTSFRHPTVQQIISRGQEEGSLYLSTTDHITHMVKFMHNKKYFYINGQKHPLKDVQGHIPTVLFYPEELYILKGSKTERRNLFDEFGIQLNTTYRTIYQDYIYTLKQRNKLLKTEEINEELFQAWTDSLIHIAQSLYLYRLKLIQSITPYIKDTYKEICPQENLDITYESKDISVSKTNSLNISEAKNYIKETLQKNFEQVKTLEKITQITQCGPHHDDIVFMLDNNLVKTYASQGQQRSIILAVKIAFISYMYEVFHTYPLLLLDDVMSELDQSRRHRLFDLINQNIQTIITTTHLEYFSSKELQDAAVFVYGDE